MLKLILILLFIMPLIANSDSNKPFIECETCDKISVTNSDIKNESHGSLLSVNQSKTVEIDKVNYNTNNKNEMIEFITNNVTALIVAIIAAIVAGIFLNKFIR